MADGNGVMDYPRSYEEMGLRLNDSELVSGEIVALGGRSPYAVGVADGMRLARRAMENESSWLNALGYHEEDGERG